MVEIRYINNENNEPVIFDLTYPIKDYIPAKYFELAATEQPIQVMQFADSLRPIAPELYFFIDLLDQAGLHLFVVWLKAKSRYAGRMR